MNGGGYFRLLLLSCVLMNVRIKALTLHTCANPIEMSMCEVVCTTPNHTETVAFYRLPNDANEIAQCIPGVGCHHNDPYTISQPNSTATVLRFKLTRNITGLYKCAYGSTFTNTTLHWGTYPQEVELAAYELTNGSVINSTVDFNVTLKCLRSAENPSLVLHYMDEQGNIDAKSDKFSCTDLEAASCESDADFKSYHCLCRVRNTAGIQCKDVYDVNGKIRITYVKSLWDSSFYDDIKFPCSGDVRINLSVAGKMVCCLHVCVVVGTTALQLSTILSLITLLAIGTHYEYYMPIVILTYLFPYLCVGIFLLIHKIKGFCGQNTTGKRHDNILENRTIGRIVLAEIEIDAKENEKQKSKRKKEN